MKKLSTFLAFAFIAGALTFGSLSIVYAVNCGQVFPTSLNNYVAGCTIPSSWANALEAKLGITQSASTTSLDYQTNHLMTAYGSEIVAIPAGGLATSTPPAKGSIPVGASSTQYGVLAVGANGTCPIASSSAPLGIVWSSCGSGGGAATTTIAGLTSQSFNIYATTTPGITTSSPNNIYIGPAVTVLTSLDGVTSSVQTFASANDTNVTLAITSSTASHTFTLGWTGTLALTRGGLGTSLVAVNNGILVTSGSGVPSFSTTIPTTTQNSITQVGTIASGTWQGNVIATTYGGTGTSTQPSAGQIPVANSSNAYVPTTINSSSSVTVQSHAGSLNFGANNYPITFLIENPTVSEHDDLMDFNTSTTINYCDANQKSTGDTVTFGLGWSTNPSASTSSLTQILSGTTVTNTATTSISQLTLSTSTATSTTPGALSALIFWTTPTNASSSGTTLTCGFTFNQ